jgi:hypothetical protein
MEVIQTYMPSAEDVLFCRVCIHLNTSQQKALYTTLTAAGTCASLLGFLPMLSKHAERNIAPKLSPIPSNLPPGLACLGNYPLLSIDNTWNPSVVILISSLRSTRDHITWQWACNSPHTSSRIFDQLLPPALLLLSFDENHKCTRDHIKWQWACDNRHPSPRNFDQLQPLALLLLP